MHLVDTTLFYAPRSGGVKRYLDAKQRWLAQRAGITHTRLLPGARDAVLNGTRSVASMPLPGSGGYRWPLRLNKWRAVLRDLQPDIIEAGDPYQIGWMAAGCARRLGIPGIAFCHSDLARLISRRAGRLSSAPVQAYLRALYEQFDLVLAPSHYMVQRLRRIGLSNCLHQPLGVDTRSFHPRRRDKRLRARLGLPAQTRLLVFAGRYAREKNIPLLLRLMQRLGSPFHLLLVGGGMPSRVPANVSVLPYVSDIRRLAALLGGSDVLIHSGDTETFGLVVIEAMACGTAVIVADAGGLPELVPDPCGLRVRGRTVAAWQAAVEGFFQGDRCRMSQAARQRVEQHFSWEQVFSLLLRRYRAVAHDPASLFDQTLMGATG